MTLCRSLAEVIAAAHLEGVDDPPPGQELADHAWSIRAPYLAAQVPAPA